MNNNIFGMFQNFMQNPMQAILQSRINLPNGMTNPNDIIQFMMDNGYVNQNQYNQARQMFNQFRRR